MQCITREPTCLTCSSLGEWYFPLSPAIEPSHSSSADDGRWSSDRESRTQTMSDRRLGPTQTFKAAPFSIPTNSAGRLAGRCLACTRTGCTAWFSKRYFPISLHLAIKDTCKHAASKNNPADNSEIQSFSYFSCSVNSLLAITTHFDGTHFFSGSSILFLVFLLFFLDNTTLYTIPLKNRGVLMQTSFCGRLPEEECVGKEILDPLAVFFAIAYSM